MEHSGVVEEEKEETARGAEAKEHQAWPNNRRGPGAGRETGDALII